ncbi:MAG TPA: hypothetical protein VGQ79_04880 [Nitrospiraceae bacterium]|nr:hypothetical protein [Nitrospiraceae bacterium]
MQSQSIAVQVAIDYGIFCGSAYRPHGSAAAAEQTKFVQRVSAAAAGWAALRALASEGPSPGPLSRREAAAQL